MNEKDFGLYRDDGLETPPDLKQIENARALSRYLKNVDSLLLVK